jgi:PAS domain S-box-containing protein
MNKGPFLLRSFGRWLFWRRPALYRCFGLVRGRGDCFDQDFDLWVGGFPRSATSFASEAFQLANPGVRLARDRHLAPSMVHWLDLGRPGLFLIREPEDAVISWAILWGGYLEESLDYYIDFHRALLPEVPRLFVATFDLITRDFGAVVEAFNQHFGTRYAAPTPGAESTKEVFSRLETTALLSGNELTVCRPSAKRAQLKPELRRRLRENPELIRKLELANELYAAFTVTPLGRAFPQHLTEEANLGPTKVKPPARQTPSSGGRTGRLAPKFAPSLVCSQASHSGVGAMALAHPRAVLSYLAFRWKRYLLPVLFVSLAVVSRLALEPVLQGRLPYSFFFVAIILTAMTSGTSETFLAVLLGFLAAEWFFIEPVRSLSINGTQGWVGAGLYFFVGLAIIWFMKSRQSARLLALSSAVEARRRMEELDLQQTRTQRMEQNRDMLAAIVEAAQYPLLSFAPDGVIQTWNGAAAALFGYPASEAIGRSLALLIPAENKHLQQDLLSSVTGHGAAEPREIQLARKDGSVVTVWLTLSPLKSPAGKLLGAAAVVRSSPG